jgi:hypothetical protein
MVFDFVGSRYSMSQYVPRTATIIAKPGNSEELKIHVSEPCTEGSVSSSLTFGWNNVLILTSAVFSARDTCKDACSTKELMTTLFKRCVDVSRAVAEVSDVGRQDHVSRIDCVPLLATI